MAFALGQEHHQKILDKPCSGKREIGSAELDKIGREVTRVLCGTVGKCLYYKCSKVAADGSVIELRDGCIVVSESGIFTFQASIGSGQERSQQNYSNAMRPRERPVDMKALWEARHVRLKRCRDGAMIYNVNDVFIGRALDKYGEISRGEVRFLRQLIAAGMTVVEVGANIGILTVPFARLVWPGGVVIAFEPQRIVHQMLCGNIAINAIENVVAYNMAVGRQAGSITVPPVDYALPGNFGGVSVGAAAAGESVLLTTIDALGLDRCDFMKIDVEGMEQEVIEGASDTLRRFRPRLYVENDRAEKSPALIEQLLALDYRLYWHTPFLYESDNFFGDQENVFEGIVSDNMVCVPRSGPLAMTVLGLVEITSKDALPPRRPA
jgi:FkbM family methyltransferase